MTTAAATAVPLGRHAERWRALPSSLAAPAADGRVRPCWRSLPCSRCCSCCCSPTPSAAPSTSPARPATSTSCCRASSCWPSGSARPRPAWPRRDLTTGMIDRFRSLPVTGAAVLAGRVAADALRNLFVVGLMIAVGAAVGFRFHAGPAALAAVALAVAAGLAFSWLNLLLGLVVRDPESAGLARLFPVIILFFTSSPWCRWRPCPAGCRPSPGPTPSPSARRAAGPVLRRPDDPARHRGPCLDRRTLGRHRPGRYHRLPSATST